MMVILLAGRSFQNYLFDLPSIIIYTLLAGIFLNYYKKYQYKGFLSISMGILVLAIHHFLRFFFFLFLQDTNSSTPDMFLRLMLLSWGLSFSFILHGIYQFKYKNNEGLLLLVYLFYGAFMGLSLFLPEVSQTTDSSGDTRMLVVPQTIVIMTTIIHFIFIFELISISINGRKYFHHVSNKTNYRLLTFGAIILLIWLAVIFPYGIIKMRLLEPFIPLIGFSFWSYGIFRHPNYLFYPKYIPHVLFVSRMNGTLIYHHDFLSFNELHQDNFPNFSLISGLFASLRIASTELFSDSNEFTYYEVGKSKAVIYQFEDFLITLLVNDRIQWYEMLMKKFVFESVDGLNNLRRNYTMNLCEPVREVFGLPT